jgi:hypothetical protein
MPSAKLNRRLWAIGVFILPVVAVKIAAVMLGGQSPQSASATPAENPPMNATSRPAVVNWTERQLAAASHIANHRGQPFGENPLLYQEEPKPIEVEVQPVPVDIEPVETPEPEIKFTLNAVMSGSRGKTALIDGRPYREGERIKGTDWDVQAIDCDHRIVTLFNPAKQRTLVVRVDLPLAGDDQTGTSDN